MMCDENDPVVGVLNYGLGNVSSILNMLKKIGANAKLVDDKEDFSCIDKLILPGVGSFDEGVRRLEARGFDTYIKYFALEQRKPILGICLGMQLLGNYSEEGTLTGLGLIPFHVKKFNFSNTSLKLPHMGWDRVFSNNDENAMISDLINKKQRYYFVHSYYVVCEDEKNILLYCEYGSRFAAAVCKDNIYGVQFHPEKSHSFGMSLLRNFVERV